MEQPIENYQLPIKCRRGKDFLVLPFLLAFIGLFSCVPLLIDLFSPSAKSGDAGRHISLVFSGFGAFFFVGAVWAGALCICPFVLLENDGIRWRSLGREKFAKWSEVTDYYHLRTPHLLEVLTSCGKISVFKRHWTNTEFLELIVLEKATQAKPNSWQILGLRNFDEWPKSYSYWIAGNRYLIGALLLTQIFMLGLFISDSGQRLRIVRLFSLDTIESEGGLPLRLFGLACFIPFLLYLFTFTIIAFCIWRVTYPRRSQHIETSHDGISYQDDSRHIAVRWKDVIDCYRERRAGTIIPCTIIKTTQGQFDFGIGLNGPMFITQVIQYKTGHTDWPRRQNEDTLDEREHDLNGGIIDGADRVFHFRTRANRAMTLLFSTYALVFAAFPFFANDISIIVTPISLFLLFHVWFQYQKTEFRVNDAGITYISAYRKVHLPWNEIANIRAIEGLPTTLLRSSTSGKKIRIWTALIDYKELLKEVTLRTTPDVS
jgi:hypothetical protein